MELAAEGPYTAGLLTEKRIEIVKVDEILSKYGSEMKGSADAVDAYRSSPVHDVKPVNEVILRILHIKTKVIIL